MTESDGWSGFLRRAMKTAGLADRRGLPRVAELARLSGVPESTIYRWLKNSPPDIDNLRRLIHGFKLAPTALHFEMHQLQYEAGLMTAQEAKMVGHTSLPQVQVVKVDPVEEEIRALGLPPKQEQALLRAREVERKAFREHIERLRQAGALTPRHGPKDAHSA